MNLRKIREDLGRVKSCCQRREFPRALHLFIAALKELKGQAAPPDLRGDVRTALATLTSDPDFKKEHSQAVIYQPGKERDLVMFLVPIYNKIQGLEGQEDYESTLQRKLNIDRCLREGKQHLAAGRVSEADAAFVEALSNYKNESSIFAMIARPLMEAGEYVRALGHIRRGLKENSKDAALFRLGEECTRLRAQSGK